MSYRYSRSVRAGCHECHKGEFHWFEANAQGVAARHAKAHGHSTFVEVELSIQYGERKLDAVESKNESRDKKK